jgi:hypothetical protein
MCKLIQITFDACNITYEKIELCGRFTTGLRCIAVTKAIRVFFVECPFDHDHRVPFDDSEACKGDQDVREGYSRCVASDSCIFG